MLVPSGVAAHPATGGLGFVSGSCEGPAGVKAALTCRLLPPWAAAALKKDGTAALDVLLSSRGSRLRCTPHADGSGSPAVLASPQPGGMRRPGRAVTCRGPARAARARNPARCPRLRSSGAMRGDGGGAGCVVPPGGGELAWAARRGGGLGAAPLPGFRGCGAGAAAERGGVPGAGGRRCLAAGAKAAPGPAVGAGREGATGAGRLGVPQPSYVLPSERLSTSPLRAPAPRHRVRASPGSGVPRAVWVPS